MNTTLTNTQTRIRTALQALKQSPDFRAGIKDLFGELGYHSERSLQITPNTAEGFINTFITPNPDSRFNEKRAHIDQWRSIDLVMQLTGDELTQIQATGVDQKEHQSYLVFAIDLITDRKGYARTTLASITREINKAFDGIPVLVAFRHNKQLTIGVVDRRAHKHDATRDVLGAVTLIHDINLDAPHRGHIDTFVDLSFPELRRRQGRIDTFEQLHRAWSKVLDTQILNEQFFADYQRLFAQAEALISGITESDDRRLFTQRLFNRLLFIRFLEEKGWVEYPNEPAYLAGLWNQHRASGGSNFYQERLATLFFKGLNNPDGATEDPLIGNVPYLNGGLFEMDALDTTDGLLVPDAAIQPVLEELFYRYKFTVTEATPLELEVAVDPEMLGKVFEELVTSRHESGSYYTPRPVVQYMNQEALKEHLLDKCPSEDTSAIRAFVEDRDPSNLRDPEAILDALRSITTVDPACGSGAYLLGMLQELLELRQVLFSHANVGPGTVYNRKLDIITQNIYGVDLDPFAVNIARMRLWLSLVVDDTRNPLRSKASVALPNLDFKVESGDSLTAPDPSDQGNVHLFRQGLLNELDEAKRRYTTAHGKARTVLREKIHKLRDELRSDMAGGEPVDGFDWRVEFSEVFSKGGFDVVLANPPYVKLISLPKPVRKKLKRLYPQGTTGQSDLYVFFYLRTLQLLRDGGLQVFVVSNSWLDVDFGSALQKHLLDHSHVQTILDSALERQFSTAAINTVISIIRKVKPQDTHKTAFISLRGPFQTAVRDPSLQKTRVFTRKELLTAGETGLGYVTPKWGAQYLRAPDSYFALIERAGNRLKPLGEIVTLTRGITSGENQFFYVTPTGNTQAGLIEVTNRKGFTGFIEEQYLRPLIKSPKEFRTLDAADANTSMLVFLCSDTKQHLEKHAPNALAFIEWGEKEKISERATVRNRPRWYDLARTTPPDLVFPKSVGESLRVFVNNGSIIDQRLFEAVTDSDKDLIAAIGNSTILSLMTETNTRTGLGDGLIDMAVGDIERFPFPDPSIFTEEQRSRAIRAFSRMRTKPLRSIFAELGLTDPEQINPEELTLEGISSDRKNLDDAVFDALGVPNSMRLTLYKDTASLIHMRLVRAETIS